MNEHFTKKIWVMGDHHIAAEDCLLVTIAAEWATRQVGHGQIINEEARDGRATVSAQCT